MRVCLYWALVCGLLACSASQNQPALQVQHAWIRATVSGQPVAAAYMQLSASQAIRIVRITSPVAESAEIHEMQVQQGVMRMRQLASLDIAAQQTLTLAPGHTHIMLINLDHPLSAGQQIPMQLEYRNAQGQSGQISLSIPVKQSAEP